MSDHLDLRPDLGPLFEDSGRAPRTDAADPTPSRSAGEATEAGDSPARGPSSLAAGGPLRPGSPYEAGFWEWLGEHRYAFDWLVASVRADAADGLPPTQFRWFWEDLRRHVRKGWLKVTAGWRQNDDHSSFCVALMEREHPELCGRFERRGRESEAVDGRALAAGGDR